MVVSELTKISHSLRSCSRRCRYSPKLHAGGPQAPRQPAIDHVLLGAGKRDARVLMDKLADTLEIGAGEYELTVARRAHVQGGPPQLPARRRGGRGSGAVAIAPDIGLGGRAAERTRWSARNAVVHAQNSSQSSSPKTVPLPTRTLGSGERTPRRLRSRSGSGATLDVAGTGLRAPPDVARQAVPGRRC